MFVGWFVHSFVMLVVISRNVKPNCHEIWPRCSALEPNFTVNFSEVKVKVKGQKRLTEDLQL